MLISTKSVEILTKRLGSDAEIFCSGLFLSARWFVVSQLDHEGIQLIVLPDRDSAEYCAADLYDLIDGDKVAKSNINRQLFAVHSTVGQYKTEAAAARLLDINPDLKITRYTCFWKET